MNQRRTIHKDYIRAGSSEITPAELSKLAQSDVAFVRRRVGENELTPEETLTLLSKDCEPEVRMAVALNRRTPVAVVAELASDEHADVRHHIASTSYMPKHLLSRLATDSNPHVAERAKVMLTGLEGAEQRRVTVFEFLSEDHAALERQLKALLKNFSDWSHEKVFDETVDILVRIDRHMERQKLLCLDWIESSSPELECESIARKSAINQGEIVEHISSLLSQDDEGPEFRASLKTLLELLRQHTSFTEHELFNDMKRTMRPEELDAINKRLSRSLVHGEII